MNILPAIDLKDGRCVRLYQGDFDRETRYSDDPPAVASGYRAAGFRQMHIVDLDGARDGRQANRDVVRALTEASGLDVQLGGGIRDRDTVVAWLEAGVQRVVIGSVAIRDPDTVKHWLQEIGADRFVLALDCRLDDAGTPMLTTHGWTRDAGTTLWEAVDGYLDAGLRHVLCTDVGRDGAMTGPSLALYREFIARYPALQLQASGGVRSIDDLYELRRLGAAAAVSGRALLDGCITDSEVATFLQGA